MPTGIYDRKKAKPNFGIFKKGHQLGFSKGYIPWNKGKKCPKISSALKGQKLSKERIAKMVESRRGYKHTEETRGKIGSANKGKKRSETYREYIAERMSHSKGKLAHNWRGGITSLSAQIRSLDEYKEWRDSVFRRDKFLCVLGGIKHGHKIQADHYPKTFAQIMKEYEIKSLEEAINYKELWNVNNGRTLCEDCHKGTTTYLRNHKK